jgi:insertion element IS1 protein InsB
VVDFEVTTRRDFQAYQPMAMRLAERYDIEISASDDCFTYQKYRIAKQHVSTKSETCLVESFNGLIRHYLARFQRKTKRYSKCINMVKHSLYLLFYKSMIV